VVGKRGSLAALLVLVLVLVPLLVLVAAASRNYTLPPSYLLLARPATSSYTALLYRGLLYFHYTYGDGSQGVMVKGGSFRRVQRVQLPSPHFLAVKQGATCVLGGPNTLARLIARCHVVVQ
jgi:hypothetical protein